MTEPNFRALAQVLLGVIVSDDNIGAYVRFSLATMAKSRVLA